MDCLFAGFSVISRAFNILKNVTPKGKRIYITQPNTFSLTATKQIN